MKRHAPHVGGPVKVAVVAPVPAAGMWGGTERAVASMCRAINATGVHQAELVTLSIDETNLVDLIDAYRRFRHLDLSHFDRVISVKYPAWMIDHPDHTVYLFHPLRGLYDAYESFGLPLVASPTSPGAAGILELIGKRNDTEALDEFFERFEDLAATEGRDAPDLGFPGPFARAIVHWLDAIALTPPRARRHFAISATVVSRPEYFPQGLKPFVLPLPTDLPLAPEDEPVGSYLFTASRLDTPKRIDLVIDAMAHLDADVPLKIAGTGPAEAALRERAGNDARIEFLGFVPDDDLVALYRGAIAVPFVPFDEDQGLISVEAASQGTPVITCLDSGGPTEFVTNGVTGLVCDPTPRSLASALERVTADPFWARRMGHSARRRAKVRNWDRAVRLLIEGPAGEGPTGPVSTGPARRRGRPRVLVAATYGIARPAHGGAVRVRRLCQALARDIDVDVLALAPTKDPTSTTPIRPGLTQTVVPVAVEPTADQDELGRIVGQPVTDIYAGVDAHRTPEYLERFAALASGADLVILAQPFLHPVISQIGLDCPFLLDTQNVELDLRAGSLDDTPETARVLDMLRRVEHDALRNAQQVSACSGADADRLSELYGLRREAMRVIPNGTDVPLGLPSASMRAQARARWFDRLHGNWGSPGTRHLAVFVGSWHPPNLDAAEFLVDLAAARPDLFIVSAGAHGLAFGHRRVPHNIVFPGRVSPIAKNSLFAAASVALNPMRTGSGTNLKLIEFLGHGVPTVSTPFGARGLPVTNGREVLLAAPDAFTAAIDRVLSDPAATETRRQAGWALARDHDWSALGTRFSVLVRDVLEARVSS